MLDHSKLQSLGLIDEKTYAEEPFEEIAKDMENLTPDGKVKKLVIRKGYGDPPQDGHQVTIDYNAYVEFNDTPFDSTYIRRRPLNFILNNGETILGLEVAVRSMQIDEKAHFLFHYDYAYGKMGCLGRIPAESTVLFEVELKKYINITAVSSYKQLSKEKQQEFSEIYRYAQAACLNAKDLVERNLKAGIREFRITADKLEYCILSDYAEQEKQQAMLLKIYTNLVVCYVKVPSPKQACFFANKIYNMVKGTSLTIHVRVYFNHAKALRMLCDYDRAAERLRKAQQLETNNRAIAEEFIILEKERKASKEKEKNVAKAMLSNCVVTTEKKEEPKKS